MTTDFLLNHREITQKGLYDQAEQLLVVRIW